MKNNTSFLIFIFFLGIFFISCKNDFDILYKQMINEKETVLLEHSDYSSSLNDAYMKICKMGKGNNNNLLELAINENSTNWVTDFSYRPLTDGDLAISLIIDINEISDEDFYLLMPLEVRNEYEKNGVVAFWDWIHEGVANREYVINQLEKLMNFWNKVAAHGSVYGVYDHRGNESHQVNPKELAAMIKSHPGYKKGMTVMLLVCNVGLPDLDGIISAQQIADAMGEGNRVHAPEGFVNMYQYPFGRKKKENQ